MKKIHSIEEAIDKNNKILSQSLEINRRQDSILLIGIGKYIYQDQFNHSKIIQNLYTTIRSDKKLKYPLRKILFEHISQMSQTMDGTLGIIGYD